MYLATFAAVLIAGVVALVVYHQAHQPSSATASSATRGTATSALDALPAPTGGGDSSDLQSPNVPMTDEKKVEDEDAKTQAEQNWKADHAEAANSTNNNVTDEDRKELDDSEKANGQPVNRPK